MCVFVFYCHAAILLHTEQLKPTHIYTLTVSETQDSRPDLQQLGWPRDCHTEWSWSDREGEIPYDIPYMWNWKRNDTSELTKQKEIHGLREWIYSCWEEGVVREFGTDVYTLLYLKSITSKNLLYSTWNSAPCCGAAWLGEKFGGEWIHVYVWLSPFPVHLKLLQHC